MTSSTKKRGALVALVVWLIIALPVFADDAGRGANLLAEKGCLDCHNLAGLGGNLAPDLTNRSRRGFTPTGLVASLWNHGPAMWREMDRLGQPVPELSVDNIRDIYAYFRSISYFDPPGDAGRGKRIFSAKRCSECHTLAEVAAWPSLRGPVQLVRNIWNHSGQISAEMERRGIPWPRFRPQEMVDLLVYLRTQVGAGRFASFDRGQPEAGEKVFEAGCADCHTIGTAGKGKIDLAKAVSSNRTMASFATQMWNHRPRMHERAQKLGVELTTFSEEEVSALLEYLIGKGQFDSVGGPARGRKVFGNKGCSGCHDAGTAPDLRGKDYSPAVLAAAVWAHGPQMLARFEQTGRDWPELSGNQAADLIAYLNRRR